MKTQVLELDAWQQQAIISGRQSQIRFVAQQNALCPYGEPGDQLRAGQTGHLLTITEVRVEQLQNISEEDAIEQGVEQTARHWKSYGGNGRFYRSARRSFRSLWESIHGTNTWSANPFVWVIQFHQADH